MDIGSGLSKPKTVAWMWMAFRHHSLRIDSSEMCSSYSVVSSFVVVGVLQVRGTKLLGWGGELNFSRRGFGVGCKGGGGVLGGKKKLV